MIRKFAVNQRGDKLSDGLLTNGIRIQTVMSGTEPQCGQSQRRNAQNGPEGAGQLRLGSVER